MGDKTLRQVLLAKIDRAIVTRVAVDGVDAITLDRALLDAAGLCEHEKVDLYDLTTGARFSASVAAGQRDTGELAVTGAAGHLCRPGDLVTLAAYAWVREKAALKHTPRFVLVDDQNRPVSPSPRGGLVVTARSPEAPRTPKSKAKRSEIG